MDSGGSPSPLLVALGPGYGGIGHHGVALLGGEVPLESEDMGERSADGLISQLLTPFLGILGLGDQVIT